MSDRRLFESVRWSRPLDDPTVLDPLVDVVRVEPYELADLEERDAALGDQATNETLGHSESLRESGYV
jgi:hypothetical protein